MRSWHLIALIVMVCNIAYADTWYEFSIPQGIDAESPANVFPVEDATQDVSVSGKHFVKEDGSTLKLWGANICYSGTVPELDDSSWYAERMRFFGYNGVRIHHNDNVAPNGIIKNGTSTQEFDVTTLQKFDMFVSELKEKGIYINLDMNVSRQFKTGEGVELVSGSTYMKGYSIFDPTLISLQKDYVANLITHVNEYTGVALVDDPVVAFVDFQNENNLYYQWTYGYLDQETKTVPDLYIDRLNALWNTYLQSKYATVEAVKAAWSSGTLDVSGVNSWAFPRPVYTDSHTGQVITDYMDFFTQTTASFYREMIAHFRTISSNKLLSGSTGSLDRYTAQANDLVSDWDDFHGYYDHPRFPGGSWDKDIFLMYNKSQFKLWEYDFVDSINTRKAWVDNNKPVVMSEWQHCYPNTQAYEGAIMQAINTEANDLAGLYQFSFSHTSDFEFNEFNSFFDTYNNPQKLLTNQVGAMYYRFGTNKSYTIYDDYGEIVSDQVYAVSGAIAGKTFRHKGIFFKPTEDGTIALMVTDLTKTLEDGGDILFYAVSDVTNTGSSRDDDNYTWGSSPILMKELTCNFYTTRNATVRELDNTGALSSVVNKSDRRYTTQGKECPWYVLNVDAYVEPVSYYGSYSN